DLGAKRRKSRSRGRSRERLGRSKRTLGQSRYSGLPNLASLRLRRLFSLDRSQPPDRDFEISRHTLAKLGELGKHIVRQALPGSCEAWETCRGGALRLVDEAVFFQKAPDHSSKRGRAHMCPKMWLHRSIDHPLGHD